jgi:hypothetical protein
LEDVVAYKTQDDVARREILDELSKDAQELGLGY